MCGGGGGGGGVPVRLWRVGYAPPCDEQRDTVEANGHHDRAQLVTDGTSRLAGHGGRGRQVHVATPLAGHTGQCNDER